MKTPHDVPGLTPIEKLFRYDIFGLPDALGQWQRDAGAFTLTIGGCVASPRSWTLERLRRRFPPVQAEEVLQCMTRVHWGRVLLKGVQLADVLTDAGADPAAVKVALRGAEGYATDLFLQEVFRRPREFLLAYEMNGEALSPEHGFPLRLAAAGKYAYKWCKWLTQIEVLDYDFKGHYEGNRGWSDAAVRGEPV